MRKGQHQLLVGLILLTVIAVSIGTVYYFFLKQNVGINQTNATTSTTSFTSATAVTAANSSSTTTSTTVNTGGGGGGGTTSTTTTTTTTTLIPPNRNEPFQKGVDFVFFGVPSGNAAKLSQNLVQTVSNLTDLRTTGADAVAFIPRWFQDQLNSTYIYPDPYQTISDRNLTYLIGIAKQLGFKTIVIKPHLAVKCTGCNKIDIIPCDNTASCWSTWFANYTNFIDHYASIANQTGANILVVGTELTNTESQDAYWRSVIASVRAIYSGKLTYGPQQGGAQEYYKKITFWDALDYGAVDAYFQLTNKCDPTLDELKAGWQSHLDDLRTWHASINKPTIFIEFGYTYYNCTNKNPGSTNNLDPLGHTDYQEQRDAYEATFETFYNESWLVGMYWFVWDPLPTGNPPASPPGLPFAVNRNPARLNLTYWYSQNWGG